MHLPCQPPVSSTSINTNTHTAQRNPRMPAPMNYTLTRVHKMPVLREGSWVRWTSVQIPAPWLLLERMAGSGQPTPPPPTANLDTRGEDPWRRG